MNILFATSEVSPFARTGGLADVSASLAVALKEQGHQVVVFVPAYRSVFECEVPVKELGIHFSVPVGENLVDASLCKSTLPGSDVPVYFIRQDDYYDRDEIYTSHGIDYPDNCERFVFFCRAVMEAIRVLGLKVDILHSNDWQTGLIPAYQSILYKNEHHYEQIATIHTVHNLAYQGIFWHWDMLLTGIGWEHFTFNELEFYGKLNLLKTGLMFADGITTVSPRYALEIQSPTFGCSLESVLQYRSPMLRGILNGVCTNHWNPDTDPWIAAQFNAKTVFDKKPLCKADLQKTFEIQCREDIPLLGVVSRLAYQKGIDLVADAIPTWVEQHNIQFCLLGQGDPNLENRLTELANRYPANVGVKIGFSDELAHKIEAGADMFLMPSRYEPCGLNQMYSHLYGTVPIVHDTGGLADTVVDLNDATRQSNTATGFSFFADNLYDLNTTIWRALCVYWQDKETWATLVRNGMRQNWSWKQSALQYIRFYKKVLKTEKS
ncbi:glycogen synthase [Planctomycetales bacterium]|nr:glycogen synthase [Planctomycetales bacterium]